MSPALNPVPVQSLAAKKALLADRLRMAAKRSATWPLSSAQQRLWFLDQLEPESPLYNLASVVRLAGRLDVNALNRALNAIVVRHEILRTHFQSAEGAPIQTVDAAASLDLKLEDLSALEKNAREEKARELIRSELRRPFNLTKDLLIRAILIRLDREEHLLLLNMHHIVSDEWSLRVFYSELSQLYASNVSGEPARLQPLAIQYVDYALWQLEWLKGERLGQSLEYWRKLLAGMPPVTELPTDHPRTAVPTFAGASLERVLSKEVSKMLTEMSRRHGVTTFMLLLAALQAFIHRHTQREDVVVASPIAGRNRPETESLIGFFVNTLPLRAQIKDDPTFSDFLAQVRESTVSAYANQDVPFEKIVEALQPERSLSHLPFTRMMFVYQNRGAELLEWPGVKVAFEDVETLTAKFDLTFTARETANGFRVRCEYNTDLFEAASVGRLLANFEVLLKGIIANPYCRLSRLPLLTEEERTQVVVEWNQSDAEYPRQECIHALFEAQVLQRPNATALTFGTQSLTYQELNTRANQLAHSLRECNVGPDVPVAICLQRSAEMVVGALAVLKAGGAYVPLDPAYPKERLVFMLDDTRAPILLTQQSVLSKLSSGFTKVFCLDADWDRIARESKENLPNVATPENLAYVMYTSGSTGKPKGVAVTHRAVNRLVLNTNYLAFGPEHRLAQVSNFSFDAATFEIWGALLNGGQLVGITHDVALSPKDFARELRERKITALFLTSALFNQVVSEVPDAFETLDTVLTGGEAMDPKWVRVLLEHTPPRRFINVYGPTENTTFTTWHLVASLPDSATSVPIGMPISNTQCYVLDRHMIPVPIGVPGELYVGGDGVARGYWNRPELTAEKFVPDGFRVGSGRLLYRTGDLVRWHPDGTIDFLGRIDQQVKIRGFRVELGEIETFLTQHPDIKECAVAVSGTTTTSKRLVAYVVSGPKGAPNASELRRFLEQRLPDYMVPNVFMPLPALPLTANGKVDRRALPEPDKVRPELARNYASPRDSVEEELTRIWENVLGVHPIGVEDKFFDLGGHSLLAVKLIARIEKAFGKKLRLATIFQSPTISQLAAILRNETSENSASQRSSLVEIHSGGTRPPLFLVHGAGGGMFWGYVNLSRYLGPDQPVFGFKSPGLDGGHESEKIETMAAEYIRDMRRVQPRGPYHLGGYCFGGNVAYEMARQLEAAGEQVQSLVLLNCAPPNSSYTRIPWTPLWAARLVKNLIYWFKYFLSWSPSQRREFFRWKTGVVARKLRGRLSSKIDFDVGNLVDLSSYPPEQQSVWAAHIRALLNYQPHPFGGSIHLFRSPGHPLWCSFDPDYGWGPLARNGIEVTVVSGAHEKILEEPCVADLAARLATVLQRTATSSSAPIFYSPGRNGEETLRRPLPDQIQFWKDQLATACEVVELPADCPRPVRLSRDRGQQDFRLSNETARRLEHLSAEWGVDASFILLAGFQCLVHRYTGATEVIIGTTLADSRARIKLRNEVAVRCYCTGETSFKALVEQAAKTLKASAPNSDVPLVSVLQEIYGAKATPHAPGRQLAFIYDNSSVGEPLTGGTNGPTQEMARDLTLRFKGDKQGFHGVIEYSADLFGRERMQRMAGHYVTLLEQALSEPASAIGTLRLLTPAETGLLSQWNDTKTSFPEDKTLWSLFEEQAARTPEAEAVVSGQVRLTYTGLRQRALLAANALRSSGAGRGTLVAVCLERSWEMVAGLLGALQTGAAYVPVDPIYPAERIKFMLEDSSAGVILTQRKLIQTLPACDSKVICVEDVFTTEEAIVALETSGEHPEPGDLAYVIYTSGSTGKPKGVALEHRNAVAFISWASGTFSAAQLGGVLASTSICFDLSIFELFAPLCSGGKVILAENALALPGLPAAAEVKLINTVPSAIRELLRVNGVPSGVTTVNLAGEPLSTELVDQIYAQTNVAQVFDLYGPTETTTYSTFTLRKRGQPATIGRPLANEEILLLDQHNNLVPVGVPGEIFIGGAGVARGYLNRPELTAERFVPHPFRAGERVYRTGDLGRWRNDGQLEYLGRRDHQVKVRGFRIELGEVEAALRKLPAVRETVVVAWEDVPGHKRLAAYLVTDKAARPGTRDIRAILRTHLPEHMIPSAFMFLDALPLTPNGKVDRKALPPPELSREEDSPFLAPRDEVEERLAAIWREVLGVAEIGVQDNFFDLGGHSLLAIRVVSRIRDSFGAQLPISNLFHAPTIEALAAGLANRAWAGETTTETSPPAPKQVATGAVSPASFVQERLWVLDQLLPGSDAYNVPAAFRLTGELNLEALRRAYHIVLECHETLRTTLAYKEGRLVQDIAPSINNDLNLVDLCATEPEKREAACNALISAESGRTFNLATGPLIRCTLVRLGRAEHVLLVVMHHAICDGWSLAVLFEQLALAYNAACAGEANVIPNPSLRYVDYSAWQREWMQGAVLDNELAFWKNALAGAPGTIALPADHPATKKSTARVAERNLRIPATVLSSATEFAHKEGTTLFMLLLAALNVTLSKWTGQKDLVTGTVMAGRNRREFEDVLGCFMNFLPLRLRVGDRDTGREILRQARQVVLEAQAHQECPFEKIVETINPQRKQDQNPLYNIGLLLQNFPDQLFPARGLSVQKLLVASQMPLLDLRFEAEEAGQELSLSCEYKTELFERGTIDALLRSIGDVLAHLASQPEAPLADFELPPELRVQAEKAREGRGSETVAVSATFTAEPLQEALSFWFKELDLSCDVRFGAYNQVFQQLLDPASLLGSNRSGANVLLLRVEDWAGNDRAQTRGGETFERALLRTVREFIAALRAATARTLKPHFVFLCPPSGPASADPARRKTIDRAEKLIVGELASADGVYVTTHGEVLEAYPTSEYRDERADELGHVPYTPEFYTALATLIARKLHCLKRQPPKVIVLDLDQTLWTGVCGEDGPKGICLDGPRRALQEFMRVQREVGMILCACSKNNEEDVLQTFAHNREMPLQREHFTSWRLNWELKSKNLKSLASELHLGLDSFIFIDDNPVECAEVEANCPGVLVLQLPEEANRIPEFLKHCWVFDRLKVTAEDRKRAEMYQQNRDRELLRSQSPSLADFLAGLELKIEIALMRPEEVTRVSQLTQRTNQFNFTTVRRSEAEVAALAETAEVYTVKVSDRFGDYGLVGVFICAAKQKILDVDTLLLSCRVLGRGVEHRVLARLGELAVEKNSNWVDIHFKRSQKNQPALDFLESIGRPFRQPCNGTDLFRFPALFARDVTLNSQQAETASGEQPQAASDAPANATGGRKFVRCREIAVDGGDVSKIHARVEASRTAGKNTRRHSYAAPHSEIEKQLCELWQKLLRVDRVGLHDDFFELGGHSLLAVRLFAEMEKLTGRKFPLVTLFQAPTVAQLAKQLCQTTDAGNHSLLVPIQPLGSKPPLYLVHGAGGDVLWGYANLAAQLGSDQPVYGIKSRGQLGEQEFTNLEDMAAWYVQQVRKHQPNGPYYVGGYCFGGNVAYEMARQLCAVGEKVALVALLDAAPSNAGYEHMQWWRPAYPLRFARNLGCWLFDFRRLKLRDQVVFLFRKSRALGRKFIGQILPKTRQLVDLDEVIDVSRFPKHELALWQMHLDALVTHVEREYPGKVLLLRTRGQPLFCSLEDDFCWGKLARGGVVVKLIPGSHEEIFVEPHVQVLAATLSDSLADAQDQPNAAGAETGTVSRI
jgi:amino acid adenylation domain-containing protein/FkbH-like protein